MKHNWTFKTKTNIYDNPWITVEHHEVITPSQTDGIYGKVHFKNIALGIIPLDDGGNTYLVGQYRYPLNEYSWEIPMGGGLLGTDPLISAQRELREETGIRANAWQNILKMHTSNSITDEVAYVYVARELSYGETDFDETEELAIRKLSFEDCFHMVMSGQITDAVSVAGILKTRLLGLA
jgi:8-oxo-dGTP pyrophosphatase MutT (NUDIX family)